MEALVKQMKLKGLGGLNPSHTSKANKPAFGGAAKMSKIRIPYELIDIIVSNLDVNSTTLSAVALANHALANIAREYRFKEVTIRSADRCNALWNLIERRSVLGHQVRSLSVFSGHKFSDFTGGTFRTTSPVDGVWVPRRAEEESFLPCVLDSLTAIQTLDLWLSWALVTKKFVEALSNLFGRSTLTILSLVDVHGIDLRPLVNCRSLQHLSLHRVRPSIALGAGPETHLPPQLRTLVVHSPPLSTDGSYSSIGLLPHRSLREYRLLNVCNSFLGQLDPTGMSLGILFNTEQLLILTYMLYPYQIFWLPLSSAQLSALSRYALQYMARTSPGCYP